MVGFCPLSSDLCRLRRERGAASGLKDIKEMAVLFAEEKALLGFYRADAESALLALPGAHSASALRRQRRLLIDTPQYTSPLSTLDSTLDGWACQMVCPIIPCRIGRAAVMLHGRTGPQLTPGKTANLRPYRARSAGPKKHMRRICVVSRGVSPSLPTPARKRRVVAPGSCHNCVWTPHPH